MIIDTIKVVAASVGITTVILNSDENIKTQLNRLTSVEDLPIMLINWDLEKIITFGDFGMMNDPVAKIDFLLLGKVNTTANEPNYQTAESMSALFYDFIQTLYYEVKRSSKTNVEPITNISLKLQIKLDSHKHSGVLGHFDIIENLFAC